MILRALGHEVYDFTDPPHGRGGFGWAEIDENWRNWTGAQYREALNHPIAVNGFNSDFEGMAWADCCVLVLPCGRSAHSEAGYMKGRGKSVYVLSMTKEEPELMYKLYDGIMINLEDIASIFGLNLK